MIRRPDNVFNSLSLCMVGFGVVTGIVFPFFIIFMGFPSDLALRKLFIAACIVAGAIVGAINNRLARIIIGSRLHTLTDCIKFIENNLLEKKNSQRAEDLDFRSCFNTVQSGDEIGEIGRALNRLVESLVLSHQNDTTVRSFSEILVSKLDLDLLVKESLEQLLEYTKATAGAILVTIDGETKIAASKGILQPDHLVSSEQVRSVIQTEKGLHAEYPKDIVIEGVLTNSYPQEALIEPLLFNGVLQGILILANSIRFDDEVKSRIDMFRPYLALAFNNALTHKRLQHSAALDPLTGAYNRRFGMARLDEEFSRSTRMTYPIGVIMFDIDHFKKVNDTYGHPVGDQVLKEISRGVFTIIRKGDILIRYGGEEFLVLMPASTKKQSCSVGERMRAVVEKTLITVDDIKIKVTISVGVSSFPEPGIEDIQALIKKADDALYAAKNSGRNRVVGSGHAEVNDLVSS